MSLAEAFPLYFPTDARRAFETEDAVRRIVLSARLASGSRVLDLAAGRGVAALHLAKEYGCDVVAADCDDVALHQLVDRVKGHGLSGQIEVRKVDYKKLPFPEGEFDCIVLLGRVLFPAEATAKELRRLLALNGHLCLTYPAKIGRSPSPEILSAWEARLGEPLMLPRELLALIERLGYEPQCVETLSDAELADLYRQCEGKLDAEPRGDALKKEIELFREHGKAAVTYAFAIARRKEPGEKPPASRDRG